MSQTDALEGLGLSLKRPLDEVLTALRKVGLRLGRAAGPTCHCPWAALMHPRAPCMHRALWGQLEVMRASATAVCAAALGAASGWEAAGAAQAALRLQPDAATQQSLPP